MSKIHTITSSAPASAPTTSKPTIIRRTSSIDAAGNIRRRRAGVYGVPSSILERKCSSSTLVSGSTKDSPRAIRRSTQRNSLRGSHRFIVSAVLCGYVAMMAVLIVSLNCPGFSHARSISNFAAEAQCGRSQYHIPLHAWYKEAAAAIHQDEQKEMKAAARNETPQLKDDDAELAKAFETEFTCHQVVTEDSTQCDIEADNGKTVRFYCPVSCTVGATATQSTITKTTSTPKEIVDGSYHNYEASFNQCAAVGNIDAHSDSCSGNSRGEGCTCQSSSQCAPISGSKCCYQGFCSYEHLAPLDLCMI